VRTIEDQDERTARTIAREHTEAAGRAASSGAIRGLGIDESVGAS
jgi:hypothetical protein